MKVFLGSSRESMNMMNLVASWVERSGHEPIRWTDPGLFPPGQQTFETLLDISRLVQAAVFIFSEDDKLWYRAEAVQQPRDNVLIEYGLFSGVLGPRHSIICRTGTPKTAIDLVGLTTIHIDPGRMARAEVEMAHWLASLDSQEIQERGTPWIYERSEHDHFLAHLRQRLSDARHIVMIGSGLAALGHPSLAKDLMERAATADRSIEIFLADPWSAAVETRLIEEQLGEIRPPDGRSGLESRLKMLVRAWEAAGSPETISISTFSHYPTFALIILDDDYFIYPYAYAVLGNFSPVLRFSRLLPKHRGIIAFLDGHHRRVKASATPAKRVLHARTWVIPSADQLCSFAAFLVPAEESTLYRYGTGVIGYDVRRRGSRESTYSDYVGSAAAYGFHVTVCDALYFLSHADLRKALADVEYVAAQFTSFRLTDINIRARYPNDHAIALTVRESSGQLEALHCECVQRVYRRAVASDYTIGASRADRDRLADRAALMTRRYKAPYILKRFEPHLTLLAQVPPSVQDTVTKELKSWFERDVTDRFMDVRHLAIMTKNSSDSRWQVVEEVPLQHP